jgi:DNA-binding response OmpR family regulator
MLILIADDDAVSCRVLEKTLAGWGHEVAVAHDGRAAWDRLRAEPAPQLAILDWQMPHRNGPEICLLVQHERLSPRPYLMLLTARDTTPDLVVGLASGADDYITKPFNADELRARLNAGIRILDLQRGLADRVRELEEAIAQIKQLQGLLPICMYCKKIRDDQNYWQKLEGYLASRTDAQFSHGICPECFDHIVKPQLDELHGDGVV